MTTNEALQTEKQLDVTLRREQLQADIEANMRAWSKFRGTEEIDALRAENERLKYELEVKRLRDENAQLKIELNDHNPFKQLLKPISVPHQNMAPPQENVVKTEPSGGGFTQLTSPGSPCYMCQTRTQDSTKCLQCTWYKTICG